MLQQHAAEHRPERQAGHDRRGEDTQRPKRKYLDWHRDKIFVA
jgi:hypothetical protein